MLGRGKTLESTVGKFADSRFRRHPRELEFAHMPCISAPLLAPTAACCAAALFCAVAMSNLWRIAQKRAFGCHRIGVTNSRGGLHPHGETLLFLRPPRPDAVANHTRSSSTSGISGLSVEEAAAFVLAFAGGAAAFNHRPHQALGVSLKQACDDLRAFYEEAAGAQPGGLFAQAMEEWFYHGTVMGEVLIRLWREGRESSDGSVRRMTQLLLLPRGVQRAARNASKPAPRPTHVHPRAA